MKTIAKLLAELREKRGLKKAEKDGYDTSQAKLRHIAKYGKKR